MSWDKMFARRARWACLACALHVLIALACAQEHAEDAQLSGTDMTSPERRYDTQGWRAVGASEEIHRPWSQGEQHQPQDPPRRRRKRKRRPHPEMVDQMGAAQDHVRYSVDGFHVSAFDSQENSRRRRPQKIGDGGSWNGEGYNDGRPRRRNNQQKRKQRPYLPDLGDDNERENSFNGEGNLRIENDDKRRGEDDDDKRREDDDYKVAPYIEEINHGLRDHHDDSDDEFDGRVQIRPPTHEVKIIQSETVEHFSEIINEEEVDPESEEEDEAEKEKELEREKQKQREIELEKEKEKQKEMEKQKEIERLKEVEKQKEIERQKEVERKKEAEKQKEIERQKELERLKEIGKQKALERERERERERIREQERERERERQKLKEKEEEKKEPVQKDKSYRKPYSEAKKQDNEETPSQGGSSDLKALLKQSGGLSLSEVLQQSNLSLSDLLTGKKHALSVLKTTPATEEDTKVVPLPNKVVVKANEEKKKNAQEVKPSQATEVVEDKPKRGQRLPPANRNVSQQRKEPIKRVQTTQETTRRRLPVASIRTRQRGQPAAKKDPEVTTVITTTEKSRFNPISSRKAFNDNLVRRRGEVKVANETVETVTEDNFIEITEAITLPTTTTTELPETTTINKQKETDDNSNRLSLKPRLRLPAVKTAPKRILNPEIRQRGQLEKISRTKVNSTENRIPQQEAKVKKPLIPAQAFQINVKDLFGMSDIVNAAKIITKAKADPQPKERTATTARPVTTATYRTMIRSTTTSTTTTTTTTKPPVATTKGVSAKEEILEVLTDQKGGEKLAKVLADRNMTLKQLVEHRERGSSQVHLADIFHNASREPNPAEPFLSKSLIEPISKEIYPLKALLEGNMKSTAEKLKTNPPPMFIDIEKASQAEESLGIVTLFDKFSEFKGQPKVLDAKEMKKDSDGSSYFTSVINVRPTDEVYRESRSGSGYQNSHKQVSEIFSSLPTYIKTEDVVEAHVVQDWNGPHHGRHPYPTGDEQAGVYSGVAKKQPPLTIDKDLDGDGLIVLEDIKGIEQIENHIAQASNQQYNEDNLIHREYLNDHEPSFYSRLPAGVKSAIIVSCAIIGTSIIVFLTIFVTCKVRQSRRNLLRYDDSFNSIRVRSPILNESNRRRSKECVSSRSISPILIEGAYRTQKINTMDSQVQKDAQDYLWDNMRDNMRKPFQ